jgi:5-formyltetrahydrofolate cyclo-ligase
VTVPATKTALREAALRRRAGCDPALGAQLAAHVLRDCAPAEGAIVAGFWPLQGEIDVLPLLRTLAGRAFRLCLPVTPARGNALTFRAWRPGDDLVLGRFGTMHPEGEALTPDFILTPLLAFDPAGNRLGYGAGYYDRTFAALPAAFRLGCAFAAQKFPHVPHTPHDIKLHAIATEAGVERVNASQARPGGSAPWTPAKG